MEENQKQLMKNILKWVGLFAIAAVILAIAASLSVGSMIKTDSGIVKGSPAVSSVSSPLGKYGISLFQENKSERIKGQSFQISTIPTEQSQLSDRKIVQNADFNLAVESVKKSAEAIQKIASDNNGYVQHSSVNKISEDKSSGFVQIKVPADKLAAAVEAIENLDFIIETTSKNISSRDVTLEFIDYEARLKILRKTEEELLTLLKKSGKLADILDVQRELNNIRIQIEQIQAQLNYLNSQIDYALISISLSEEIPEFLGIRWKPIVKIKEEIQNLLKGLRDYGNFLIKFIVYYLPLFIIWAVLIGLILWILNKIYHRLKIKFNWQYREQIQLNNLNFWLKFLAAVAIVLMIFKILF